MKITSVADLTAKQVSYAPEIDKTQRPTPPQGESTPEITNPSIKQGETTPVVGDSIINQGETTPAILTTNVVQGETTPAILVPNIIQGETTPIVTTPNIVQGETTPTITNPIINQGETTPSISNPNIVQGETTPIISNPNIQQGSTDPIISIPNIQQGNTTPIITNPIINQGETTPTVTNPSIVQGETTPIITNPVINQGSTDPVINTPSINQGSTDPVISSPNIVQGSTTPISSNPNIVQGSTTPVSSNPNIVQGSTTPISSNPVINQGSTTPTISNPNINQGSTTPTPSNPTINQGSTTPTPSNPTINQGSTTPSVLTPNINQGSTTPSILTPNINQGSTTPSVLTPNINQGSTTPTPSNPTINQGSTTPTPSNPTINQGSTTPSVLTPNIQQGSTTPSVLTPNINQGSTTPSVLTPNIQQGSTTPSVLIPIINQGSTTPSVLTPNINQGSTTPSVLTPNINQGSVTPTTRTVNIQQGSVTPSVINYNINQGATLVNTQPGNWLSPRGGTYSSEQFARSMQISIIDSVGVLNSIRAGQAVDVPLFTTPIIGETVSSLAGFNVPIIGGASIGPLISGLAGGGLGVSVALYMASLPLTLYRRPEGALIIANIAATIAYTQMKINNYADSKTPRYIDDNGDVILDQTTLYLYDTGPITPDPNLGNWGDAGGKRVGQGSVAKPEGEFDLTPGEATKGADFDKLAKDFKNIGPELTSQAGADKYIPYMNPTIFQGDIGNNGTPAKEFGTNTNGTTWSTLPYETISDRANRALGGGGIPLDPPYYLDGNVLPYNYDRDGYKEINRSYKWYLATEQSKINPQGDPSDQDNKMIVDPMMGTLDGIDDFIKFSFKDLRTNESFQFRSYLENISDKFNPNWQDVNYLGRPNPLKTFVNVTRDVSLDFIVPALNKGEMQMMYNKLTRLARLTMPTGVGVMRAPILEFTIGDWFTKEIGHINNLTFTVENDYTWEINDEIDFVELPHIIKVSLGIFIIGNTAMETKAYNVFGERAYNNGFTMDADELSYATNPNNPNNNATSPANDAFNSVGGLPDYAINPYDAANISPTPNIPSWLTPDAGVSSLFNR